MTAEPLSNEKTALLVTAKVLEAIRPYCLLELTTKYPVSHEGRRLGAFTVDEALDLADAELEQLQQKREPVLRPALHESDGPEPVGEPGFAGSARAQEGRR